MWSSVVMSKNTGCTTNARGTFKIGEVARLGYLSFVDDLTEEPRPAVISRALSKHEMHVFKMHESLHVFDIRLYQLNDTFAPFLGFSSQLIRKSGSSCLFLLISQSFAV